MPWFSLVPLFLLSMNGLQTEFIDSCARELGSKRLRIQLLWDQTRFENLIERRQQPVIRGPDWVDFPLQLFSHAEAVAKPAKLDRFNTKFHLSEVSWVASENKKLNLALQCWKVIVLDSTQHTDLGRLLMQCIEHGRSEDYIWQVVSDTFCNKATATLRARSASLLAFGRWKKTAIGMDHQGIFPISEVMAYDYLCDLRRLRAAPSKGKRFLEAVGFSKGLLGASVDEVLKSARVKGVATCGNSTVPVKKIPLTVQQLIFLEKLAMIGHGQESVFAGYICFIVHCRLRWSDGQHCIKEPVLDVHEGRGFLEAALYHHKTAQKRRTRVMCLLPVAGVIPGVSGCNWALHWLNKRRELGLSASLHQPVMPAPMSGGGWAKQPLSSSEASIWLREILHPWSETSVKEIATHSAKATILSWMSKANIELPLRRLAGYHVIPGDKSALEYSRDAAAPVLRQIEGIFIAIRAGIFRPDLNRSMRWCGAQTLEDAIKTAAASDLKSSFGVQPSQEVSGMHGVMSDDFSAKMADRVEGTPSHQLPGFDDDTTLWDLRAHDMGVDSSQSLMPSDALPSDMSESNSSVESSTESDSGSDDLERRAEIDGEKNSRDLVAPSDLSDKECFRHVRSRKLHFVGRCLYDIKYFKCGRKCNSNYEKLTAVPAFAAHGCMMCFGWSQSAQGDSSD